MIRLGLAAVLTLRLVLSPLGVEAQAGKATRIGILSSQVEGTEATLTAFRQGLSDLKIVEGEHLALIHRADARPERLPGLAAELVRLKVDLIVAPSDPEIASAQKATTAYVKAGCLMAYGTSLSAQWQRAAYFVGRILKGARPGDLPVEQPTKFDLLVNVTTAKALGLAIPQSVLGRADQVIE